MNKLMVKNPKNLDDDRVIKNYFKKYRVTKLHLGCGKNILDSWLNADLIPSKRSIYLDVKKPFRLNNNSFDYIFFEHLIEHLEYEKGLKLLRECFRILKPSGRIRISTPDLRFLIKLYNPQKSKLQKKYISWAVNQFLPSIGICEDAFVINNFFQNWGHKFIYDFKVLKNELEKIGFVKVVRCNVGKSSNPNFQNIEKHGKVIGEEFNKLESLVVEATKSNL